jgi:hypothetical protein
MQAPVLSEEEEKLAEALSLVKVQSFHMQCSLDKGNLIRFLISIYSKPNK